MMIDVIGWMETHEKLAGWAQAIGAVVAILAAFAVANLQARYALKHEDRRTAERVRALSRVFGLWRDICKNSQNIREHQSEVADFDTPLRQNFPEFNSSTTLPRR